MISVLRCGQLYLTQGEFVHLCEKAKRIYAPKRFALVFLSRKKFSVFSVLLYIY